MPTRRTPTSPATPRKPAATPAAAPAAKRARPAAAPKRAAPKPATAAAAPAAAPAKAPVAPAPEAVRPAKSKAKLVRDSFTMPQADFDLVASLKQRALRFERPTKKSELLRAGLHVLATLDDERLRAVLDALTPLKPGRPKKGS